MVLFAHERRGFYQVDIHTAIGQVQGRLKTGFTPADD
jgi:hypothetical protein